MKFQKGQSGNPKGRPKGKRDSATLIRELLDKAAPDVVDMTLEAARAGDTTAMRALLDKIVPNARPERRPVTVTLLGNTPADKARYIIDLVSNGQLSTDQADDLMAVLVSMTKIIESTEFVERLEQLEAHYGNQQTHAH